MDDAVLVVCCVAKKRMAKPKRLFTFLQTRQCLCGDEVCGEHETVLSNAAVFNCADVPRGFVAESQRLCYALLSVVLTP